MKRWTKQRVADLWTGSVAPKLRKIAEGDRNSKAVPTERGQQQQHINKGDTLWSVAREYGFDTNAGVKELIKHNPHIKNKDKIWPGDKINIPNRWINK